MTKRDDAHTRNRTEVPRRVWISSPSHNLHLIKKIIIIILFGANRSAIPQCDVGRIYAFTRNRRRFREACSLLATIAPNETKVRYPRFEERLHQESNLGTPKGLDFKSSAIPLCDEGIVFLGKIGF